MCVEGSTGGKPPQWSCYSMAELPPKIVHFGPPGRVWPSNTEAVARPIIVDVGEAELFPFYILHWQYEAKMGENSPVDTSKSRTVAGSNGYLQLAIAGLA